MAHARGPSRQGLLQLRLLLRDASPSTPRTRERVYIQGVPMLSSRDGGKTWKGLDDRGVHVDYHAIWIDPKSPRRLVHRQRRRLQRLVRRRRDLDEDQQPAGRPVHDARRGQRRPLQHPRRPPGQRRDAGALDLQVRQERSRGVEVDLRRRRKLRRRGPEGPERRLRRSAVRHRGAPEPQDGRARSPSGRGRSCPPRRRRSRSGTTG